MRNLLHFLPIITTLVSIPFAIILYRRWREKPAALYLMWWMIGVLTYAAGTVTESLTTLFGWNLIVFKSWYIVGALLGGAPLAQGTIYLLMKRKTAHILTTILVTVVVIAAVCVTLSPVNTSLAETYRLSGAVLEWQWVRGFSPFINLYAVIFLVGGAAWSAWRYSRQELDMRSRMWGNIWIALGAILPGIGGAMARFGIVEGLYVGELIGLLLIWLGYQVISNDRSASIHGNQVAAQVRPAA
jgi:hypothetical protein